MKHLAALVVAVVLFGCSQQGRSLQGGPPEAGPHLLAANAPPIGGPEQFWKYVNPEGQKASYSISLSTLTLLSGLNVGVIGSASKVIKIQRVAIGPAIATAFGKQTIAFIIESPLPTGGGPATGNGYRFDTNDPQSSGQWVLYTTAASACPGGCTRLDNPRDAVLVSTPGVGDGGVGNAIEWRFCGGPPQRCPTLRSATEIAVVSVAGGGAVAGQNVSIDIDWTEE